MIHLICNILLSVSETPAILLRLRAETHPYHEAVEQNAFNQALAAGSVTATHTAWFLAKLYGFVQPIEAVLRAHAAEFEPAWQLNERYRAAWLLEDLARLSYAGTPPPCPALPPLHSWPQRLGALYVLEGSTLGGQIIARQLTKAGLEAGAYFTGRAERTGPLWKSFCQQLGAAGTIANQSAIAGSAIHTFQTLSAWFNQP